MKCILSFLIVFSLLATGLTACTGRGADADTTTSADKQTVSTAETSTEPSEQSQADEITAVITEAVTVDPAILEAEKQAKMKEIYETTEARILPIGGWSTPAAALRDGYTGTAGSYDAVFQTIAESGINFMITLEEWSSGSWPLESLSSAKKAGLKLWYNGAGQGADYTVSKVRDLLASPDADALGAIYVKDEPSFDQIGETAELISAVRAELGEDSSLPVLGNLLPTYANTAWFGGDYRTYVRTYLDTAKPSMMMFDFYPYPKSGDNLPALAANIAIAKEEADKSGIPLYSYVQTSADTAYREPNAAELRLNVHLNLAMGVKGIAYFLVCEHYEGWSYSNMIDYAGNKTAMFDTVKTVNDELNAMKGVYLDYDCKGLMICNYAGMSRALEKAGCSTEVTAYGHLTSAEVTRRGKAVVGCFENSGGDVGYYLVNLNYQGTGSVDLTFDGAMTYELWSGEGLEDIGTASALTVNLEAGEGVFLKVKPSAP